MAEAEEAQAKVISRIEVRMPRKEQPIWVHRDVAQALREAKLHFEGLTKTRMTWSAWLYALACGALAVSALGGIKIKCPLCGDFGMQLHYTSFQEEANSEHPGEVDTHPS